MSNPPYASCAVIVIGSRSSNAIWRILNSSAARARSAMPTPGNLGIWGVSGISGSTPVADAPISSSN